MFSKSRKLQFENLESRELLYASAFLNGGILTINADAEGGIVNVSSDSGHTVHIQSLNRSQAFAGWHQHDCP